MIDDINLNLETVLCSTKMKVSDILELEKGSIIDFFTPANSSAKLFIEKKYFADGFLFVKNNSNSLSFKVSAFTTLNKDNK